jgi:cobaltochelatase CobS
MAYTQKQKENILNLINTGNAPQDTITNFETRLQSEGEQLVQDASGQYTIQTIGSTPPPLVVPSTDPYYQIMVLLKDIVENQKGKGGVDADAVKGIIKNYLNDEKVHRTDLGKDVIDFIDATRPYEIKFPEMETRRGKTIFPEPITSLILSDLLAQNNVYLYGGAGTGKSFIAEKIGEELLNCKVYTLPCNQYTSPLDLIGGQTIEGYVEGIVTRAYGNLDVPSDKDGALLLLDEMPKLDPNTAGVLNDMLAKIKRGAPISNGRQQEIKKGKKVYVMATGNILLNREDPAYSGNTKQDLSLQDRFAGSCYEFIIELYSEKASMMGFLFIWNYLTKLRFLIMDKRYDNFAFVSRRLVESLRDTQAFYMAQKKRVPTEGMKEFPAKTVIQAMESFFDLFLPEQIVALKAESNYDAWKLQAIQAMNRPEDQEFVDTLEEVKESDKLAETYMNIQLNKYKYLKPQG